MEEEMTASDERQREQTKLAKNPAENCLDLIAYCEKNKLRFYG